MSILISVFDVLRGWPDSSGLWYDFVEDADAASEIEEGEIVAISTEAPAIVEPRVDRHTSVLDASGNKDNPWLVIRGRESSDSDFVGKLTCLKMRTGIVFRIATLETPDVADPLWADAGVLTATDPGANAPPLGKVLQFNATEGWMDVES